MAIMRIQKVQVHEHHDCCKVQVWRKLNEGPKTYPHTKRGRKKRAIKLAMQIAEENGLEYEYSDQRGCRTKY